MRIEMEQGSDIWKTLRLSKISASDCSVILGCNPYCTIEKLLQKKLGLMPEEKINEAMARGTRLEPEARDRYCKRFDVSGEPTVHVGVDKPSGFFQLPDSEYDWAMCSTDLLVDDHDLVAEFKSGKLSFKQACRDYIPDYYLCQIQHILWLTSRSVCHYGAYDGKEDLIVMEVKRNDDFISEMIDKEYEFYQRMENERASLNETI